MNKNLYCGQENFVDFHLKAFVSDSHFKNVVLIVGGVLFMALMAQISLPLPFTPVPLSGQSFAVLLIGSLYGPKRAFLTLMSYLASGAAGLPFFAGASFGLAKLVGPTGGYLLGFVVAAVVMGYFSEGKKDRSILSSVAIFALGHFIIFSFGLVGLSFYVGIENAWALGLVPFIPGMIVKTLLASGLSCSLWKSKMFN